MKQHAKTMALLFFTCLFFCSFTFADSANLSDNQVRKMTVIADKVTGLNHYRGGAL